jgi:hypothetical protein
MLVFCFWLFFCIAAKRSGGVGAGECGTPHWHLHLTPCTLAASETACWRRLQATGTVRARLRPVAGSVGAYGGLPLSRRWPSRPCMWRSNSALSLSPSSPGGNLSKR